jgi:hypothetical protein
MVFINVHGLLVLLLLFKFRLNTRTLLKKTNEDILILLELIFDTKKDEKAHEQYCNFWPST